MKEAFEKLYGGLKMERQKSPWSRQQSIGDRLDFLKEEIDEVSNALERNDLFNFHEELGDVLWDLISLIIVAEEKHKFNAKEIIESALEKLKRRKPWVFTEGEVSPEEEGRIWSKAKQIEKLK